jgi:hypothetical protein
VFKCHDVRGAVLPFLSGKRTSNDATPHQAFSGASLARFPSTSTVTSIPACGNRSAYTSIHSPFQYAVRDRIYQHLFGSLHAPRMIGFVRRGVFRSDCEDKLCEEDLRLEEGGSTRTPGPVMPGIVIVRIRRREE